MDGSAGARKQGRTLLQGTVHDLPLESGQTARVHGCLWRRALQQVKPYTRQQDRVDARSAVQQNPESFKEVRPVTLMTRSADSVRVSLGAHQHETHSASSSAQAAARDRPQQHAL